MASNDRESSNDRSRQAQDAKAQEGMHNRGQQEADPSGVRKDRIQKVIDALNKARSMELYAILQYMNQHFTLSDQDYGKLAANVKLISIDEMRHAERFAERIKELEGEPTSGLSDTVVKGQEIREIFPFDTNLEGNTIEIYNELLAICRENNDMVSAALFEEILDEEQEHYNYFGDSRDHIEELGNSFLAKMAATSSSTGTDSKGFVNSKKE